MRRKNKWYNESNSKITQAQIAPTIDRRVGASTHRSPYVVVPQAFRIRNTEGVSSTLQGEAGGTGAKTGLYMVAQALQTDGMLRQGSSFGTNNPQSSRNIRRLTPTECERLQGFSDGFTEGVSDTQRYRQLGNAVTVNVIEAIVSKLIKRESND